MSDAMALLMESAGAHSRPQSTKGVRTASEDGRRPATAVSSSSSSSTSAASPSASSLSHLSSSARRRVFVDPVGVGAFLAAEGRLARVQAAHRATLEMARRGTGGDSDAEEEERGTASAAAAAAAGGEDALGSLGGGRPRSAGGLKLNRRMQGSVPDFFECLRATLREVAESDEHKRQAAAAANAHAQGGGTAAAAAGGADSSSSLLFDAGPLTRAMNAKAHASAQVQARRDATKREAQLRKLRPPGGAALRPDDADESDKKPRAHDAEEDSGGGEDESAHHRLCLPQICVPPTITYYKGVATNWYFSSGVDGSIKRKHARNLTPDRIVAAMAAVTFRTPWQTERPLDVVAVFYHSEPHLPPAYLGQESMRKFVKEDSARLRVSGVLQKFVPPQAEYNSMLRVTWSPSMCLVERRTSCCKLDARRLRVEERVQTYEVATGLGVEVREEAVHDTSSLRRVLHDTCNAIAEHLTIVHGVSVAAQQSHVISNGAGAVGSSGGGSGAGGGGGGDRSGMKPAAFACHPIKMTLYFKLAGDSQLFLLLCDELRWSKVNMDEVERAARKQVLAVSRRVSPDLYANQRMLSSTATPSASTPAAQQRMLVLAGGENGGGGGGYRSAEEKEADQSSPDSAALLDAFAARRRHIEHASRAHSKQLRATSAAAAAAAQNPSAAAAPHHAPPNMFDVIPGPLGTRQKRGEIKCGHCAVTLTAANSALSATAAAAASASSASPAPVPSFSSSGGGGRPFLDLHSLLLYRLTLCLHLLPASPPPGSNFPPAHWANLQTIRSAFFWNLARPILVPAYMDDEKELKVHLYFQEAQRMARHADEQRRRAGAGAAGAFTDDSSQPLLLASPSAAAVGRASASKGGVVSIWDTRIYVCRACSDKIRVAKKKWTTPPAANATAAAAAAAASPIHSVFDTLLDAYIEHERLRDQLPGASALLTAAVEDVPDAPSPRAIAAHARALARLHLGPPDAGAGGGGNGSGGSGSNVVTTNIYAGPPLRSPNPALPLPPPLPQAPTIDGDGELSWPVHSASSAATLQVAFGSSVEQGFKISAGTGGGGGGGGSGGILSASELHDSWFSGRERTPGERVRTLLQVDALNPTSQSTSLLAELTRRVLEDGPGSHLNRHEREKARAIRQGYREERRERQARYDADAARSQRHDAAASDSKCKARYQHVQSKVMLSPEAAAAAQQRDGKTAATQVTKRSEDDDDEYSSFDDEHDDGDGSGDDADAGKLSRAHERILARLARLDPVRARVIRSKAQPGGGALAPHAWNPDSKHAARVRQNLDQQLPEQIAADEAEWERVKAQLREWQRKQQAKEAAARARAAEIAATDVSGTRPRSLSHSASVGSVVTPLRFNTGTTLSTLSSTQSLWSPVPALDAEGRPLPPPTPADPFDPSSPAIERHLQADGRPPLFGPVSPIPLQHKRDFPPYRSAERIFVSGTEMMLARGAYGTGQPRSRSVSRSPTRPGRRRNGGAAGASPSPSPHRHESSQLGDTTAHSDADADAHVHHDAHDEQQEAAVAAAEAALLQDRAASSPPRKPRRASSAHARRNLAHSHSTNDVSAVPQLLPTTPARPRLSSATHSQSAVSLHGSEHRPPTAAESSRAAFAAQVLRHGYNNAAAFASATSPYQQPLAEQQQRRLRGFVPAGWDHARQTSYSTRFGTGQRGAAGGPQSKTKGAKGKESRPATTQLRSLEQQRLQMAEARALGLDDPSQWDKHAHAGPAYSPPKSLAVYATAPQSSAAGGGSGAASMAGDRDGDLSLASSPSHASSHIFLEQTRPSRPASVSHSRRSMDSVAAASRLRTPASSAGASRRSSASRSRREGDPARVLSGGALAAAADRGADGHDDDDDDEDIDDAPIYSSDSDGSAGGTDPTAQRRTPWADQEQETLQAIEQAEKRLFDELSTATFGGRARLLLRWSVRARRERSQWICSHAAADSQLALVITPINTSSMHPTGIGAAIAPTHAWRAVLSRDPSSGQQSARLQRLQRRCQSTLQQASAARAALHSEHARATVAVAARAGAQATAADSGADSEYAWAAMASGAPPLLPLRPLLALLDDMRQLHDDTVPLVRGQLCPLEDASDGSESQPSLPAALVLPLGARLLLQSAPPLPSLLTALSRLPVWHAPLVDALLHLLERIFVPSDEHTEHPQARGLIAAMPTVPAGAPAQMQRPPSGSLAQARSAHGAPARMAPVAGGVRPDYSVFAWIAECLQCMDGELRAIYRRTRPICELGGFSSLPPLHQVRALRKAFAVLREFLRSGLDAQQQRQQWPSHTTLHERACAVLQQQWDRRQADLELASQLAAAKPAALTDDEPDVAPASPPDLLLPDLFFWRVCQLIDVEGIDSTTTADASNPSLATSFSPPLLRLLDPLVQHTCTFLPVYERRQQERQSEHRLLQFHLDPHEAAWPGCSAPTSAPASAVDYFFHFLLLHSSRVLPALSLSSRTSLYERFPSLFETQLLTSLSRMLAQDTSVDAASSVDDHVLVDECMRPLLGIVVAPSAGNGTDALEAAASRSSPSPVIAAAAAAAGTTTSPDHPSSVSLFDPLLSPFVQFRSPSALRTSVAIEPSPVWQHHAPIGLYQQAMYTLQQLCIDSNAEVALSALHWMQCAYSHRLSMEVNPDPSACSLSTAVHLASPSLHPLSLALAAPCTLAHLLVVWQHVHQLVGGAATAPPHGPDTAMSDATDSAVPADSAGSSAHLRRAVWLLLCQHRQWLDFALAIFSLPIMDDHESLERAASSLLAFSLAPADERLAAQLQDLLCATRRRLCVTPLRDADLVAALSALRQQTGRDEELHVRLCCLFVPWLTSTEHALTWKQHLLGASSQPNQARETHLYRCLVRVLLRWLAGVVVSFSAAGVGDSAASAGGQTDQANPKLAASAGATAAADGAPADASSLPSLLLSPFPTAPFHFSSVSASFVHALKQLSSRMVASRDRMKALHARLKQVFDICHLHANRRQTKRA